MNEPATRRLDRGLPRLDMRSPDLIARQQGREAARPGGAGAAGAAGMLAEARKLLAAARRDRECASAELAEARVMAATIIAEAEAAVRPVLDAGPRLPSVAAIQKAVAERYGITVSAIVGRGNSRMLTAARYEAMRLARAARPDLSTTALGRLFRRDHSIILRAIKGKGPRP